MSNRGRIAPDGPNSGYPTYTSQFPLLKMEFAGDNASESSRGTSGKNGKKHRRKKSKRHHRQGSAEDAVPMDTGEVNQGYDYRQTLTATGGGDAHRSPGGLIRYESELQHKIENQGLAGGIRRHISLPSPSQAPATFSPPLEPLPPASGIQQSSPPAVNFYPPAPALPPVLPPYSVVGQPSAAFEGSHIALPARVDSHPSHGELKKLSMGTRKYFKDFVQRNVKQKKCVKFVQKESSHLCCCGAPHEDHEDRKVHSSLWKMDRDIREEPCYSFGEIEFVGFGQTSRRRAPFIRVSDQTDPEILWKIMTAHWGWKMKAPNLLISITGGAKKFFIKERIRQLFSRGLIKAASSTGAWIMTGGTGTGVMKLVGKAIFEETRTSTHDDSHPIYSVGICTWGIIDNKNVLTAKQPSGEHMGNNKMWPAEYCNEDLSINTAQAPLDCYHSHFILVDSGMDGRYGGEIKLRSELEEYIKQRALAHLKQQVPVVLVVVQGGPNTLKTVKESVENNVPAVIVAGSGKAADLITYAFRKSRPDRDAYDQDISKDFNAVLTEELKDELRRAYGEKDENKLNEHVKVLQTCIKNRKLITIFKVEGANARDIDGYILQALLQAQQEGDTQFSLTKQLDLALDWNRCDIAKEEIFIEDRQKEWQKAANLNPGMLKALLLDRVDFVELLLNHGTNLKKFLTIERLYMLYHLIYEISSKPKLVETESVYSSTELLKELIEETTCVPEKNLLTWYQRISNSYQGSREEKFLLPKVGRLISILLGDEFQDLYDNEQYIFLEESNCKTDNEMEHFHRNKSLRFEHPEQHLFFWALLLNRKNMAALFWKYGSNHMAAALTASKLLKSLAEEAEEQEELGLSNDLLEHANHFEEVAVGILTECYTQNKHMAHQLLIRALPVWGDMTCFAIADSASQMKFMEHSSCQTKLNSIWKGNMHVHTPDWKLVLAIIPFFLPLIKFTRDRSTIHKSQQDAEESDDKMQKILSRDGLRKVEKVDYKHWSQGFYAFKSYYKAPVTKFLFNLISYLAFLAIFSFFLLTQLPSSQDPNFAQLRDPSIYEWIVIGWAGTLIIEELRQLFSREARTFRFKLNSWFNDSWNRLDLIMYCSFLFSVILRFTLPDESFDLARVMYCFSILFFFLRLLQMGFVAKDIGPKIVMIQGMLADLMYFFVVLVVFMLGFGVATQAILFPHMEVSFALIEDVLYRPYWQLYGELFLEEVEGRLDNSTCQGDPRLDGYCPAGDENYRWIAPLLTAFYMLISNVLLLNLLIAMFSFTFERIQEKSESVYRFHRYELIYEYFNRPPVFPPLIIFNHAWRAYIVIKSSCNHKKKESNHFKLYLDMENERDKELGLNLITFEKRMTENYFIKQKNLSMTDLHNRVTNTGERIDVVINELESIKESLEDKITGDENLQSLKPLDPLLFPQGQQFLGGDDQVDGGGRTLQPGQDHGQLREQVQGMDDRMVKMEGQMNSIVTMLEKMQGQLASSKKFRRQRTGLAAASAQPPLDEDS